MTPALRLRLLGSIEIRDGADVLRDAVCAQPKRAALIAYLAIAAPGQFIRRDTLLALFWPESTETQARRALNQAMHFLRAELGAELIVSQDADSIGLALDGMWCDVLDFDDAVRRAAHVDALALYRGHLLEGFSLSGLSEFDQWLDTERRRRATQAAAAAWSKAEDAAATGSSSGAIEWGRLAYTFSPDETGLRRLVTLYDRVGDRAGALQEYEQFARTLRSEYDAEPAPETQALVAAVRARMVAASVEPPPPQPRAVAPVEGELSAAASSRPDATAMPRERRRWRMRRWRTVTALGLLIAAGALSAFQLMRRSELSGAPLATGRTIAVFPFVYRGGKDLGYLGESVASLLTSNLTGAGDVHAVDSRALDASIQRDGGSKVTLYRAASIANSFDAGLFIVGDVTESGGKLRVDASLYDRTGSAADVHARVEGPPSSLFELVDQLTRTLMEGRSSPGATELYRSAALTTHSIEAFRSYLAGETEFRAGRYANAVQAFRRALVVDTSFALAYYRLSTAANWTGEGGLAGWAARGALAHRDRVSPRDRVRIEAWDAYLRGDAENAERLYASVLAENGNDVEALFHTADIHFHWGGMFGRPVVEQGAEWKRVLELDPLNAGILVHAARVAATSGDRVWFDSLSARIDLIGPDPAQTAEVHALHAFAFGDRASRRAAADELRLIPESVRRGIFRNVASASTSAADVIGILSPTLFFEHGFESFEEGQLLVSAEIALAAGEAHRARATVDSAALLKPVRAQQFRAVFAVVPLPDAGDVARRDALSALSGPVAAEGKPSLDEPLHAYLRGVLGVRLHDSSASRRSIEALEHFSSSEPSATEYAHRFARLVRAEVERSAGRAQQALATLGDPRVLPDYRLPYVWSYPLAHERFLRAELLAALGRTDEALRWYATFPDPNAYDFMFLPAARFRTAELLERAGKREQAADAYDRFASLWAVADPELQSYVRVARSRSVRLRGR